MKKTVYYVQANNVQLKTWQIMNKYRIKSLDMVFSFLTVDLMSISYTLISYIT